MPKLIVRTLPSHGDLPRYRAGLGPFGREPVEIDVTPEQADALRADPVLLVDESGDVKNRSGAGASSKATKKASEASNG